MDQVMKRCLHTDELLRQVTSALADGAILADQMGNIVWIDEQMRARLNGGLQALKLPIRRSDGPAIDCFITTAEVMIGDKLSAVCVIQQTDQKDRRQFIAAIEAVMADSTWFTRTIVEKFNALRQDTPVPAQSSDIDILTDREREVLWLICEGRSDGEMGRMLHLSQNTVRNHIASLYRKIGVNRRSAAVIWARERAITSHDALGPRRTKRSRPMSRDNALSY